MIIWDSILFRCGNEYYNIFSVSRNISFFILKSSCFKFRNNCFSHCSFLGSLSSNDAPRPAIRNGTSVIIAAGRE